MNAKRILILNGPNLNLLGNREPEIYGSKSFEDYFVELEGQFPSLSLSHIQSNHDALSVAELPIIEVHISNITQREIFRHDSLLSPVCVGAIFGFGLKSYDLALHYF